VKYSSVKTSHYEIVNKIIFCESQKLINFNVVHCTKNWCVTCSVDLFKACNFYVDNIPHTRKAIFAVCNAISVQCSIHVVDISQVVYSILE
jgi:hypothetical protein